MPVLLAPKLSVEKKRADTLVRPYGMRMDAGLCRQDEALLVGYFYNR